MSSSSSSDNEGFEDLMTSSICIKEFQEKYGDDVSVPVLIQDKKELKEKLDTVKVENC